MGRTHELLRQAESILKKRQKQDKILSEFEPQLHEVGLNENLLSRQSLSEIRSSLTMLNLCIKSPAYFLKLISSNGDDTDAELMPEIIHKLLKLKRFALMRYDILVNRNKCGQIRRIVKQIKNQDIQSAIENSLYQLELKDKIVKKEYLEIDQII